ncbi:MAG TPA: tetratricopeptide repeat protein [Bryobacteraceae bacterium]|nr:tetratricopeptide repeat protein [Bryobacteraceae bacterium]
MTDPRAYKTFPLTVALATLIVFLPALWNGFVDWDDVTNFVENMNYRGLGLTQIHWMWTSHLMNRYIPITWMTLGLDYTVWGMEPLGYHLTNILWHAANAVIFYFLAVALFRRAIPETAIAMRVRIPLGALFAALVFALHPLRVESVAWVTERRDLVSGFFYLLAILVYVRGVSDTPRHPLDRQHYWGCFALFVLGILSKEMVVTLPAILLILDVYPLRRLGGGLLSWFGSEARKVWLEKIPFFAVSLGDSAYAFYVAIQEHSSQSFSHLRPLGRFAVSIYGLAYYLWKTILPIHLSPMHALTLHRIDPRGLPFQLSAVAVIWMVAAVLVLRRRFPALPAVVLAYAITLIPVLGIFHNGRQIAADRYTYLACLGWALLAGAALLEAKRLAVPAVALVGGVLGFLTWQQVQVWRDSMTLWNYCADNDPSSVAYNNVGGLLGQQGDLIAATEYLRRAAALDPDNGQARNNFGNVLLHLQDWDNAALEFEAAQKLVPDLANAYWGLGCARMNQGRLDEAISQFQTALRLDPNNQASREKLAEAIEKKKSTPQP